MSNSIIRFGGASLLLLLFCGCSPAQVAEPVTRSHCGLISHDVPNLNAVDPRRAYWCKSDIDGYLGEEEAGHPPRYGTRTRGWMRHHRYHHYHHHHHH
jgi:hypothetical protein